MIRIVSDAIFSKICVTESEIARRKQLVQFGSGDMALLAGCRPCIERQLEEIVAEFFAVVGSDHEVAALIGDGDTFQHLHATQRNYILELFDGATGLAYVTNRLRIGLLHQQVGVQPKLYLSAMRVLKEILFRALEKGIDEPERVVATCRALDKLLYFDITLVFDTYTHSLLSEVESARDRLAGYAADLEAQVEERTRQLEGKVSELERALALVKRLEGVIPICGICKKIRNDHESWQQLELYISEHSEALFSHGLCPDCYQKEMNQLKAFKEAKTNRKVEKEGK
ncbi:protoglobin domain-containing protein [Geomonas sp. Red32]|uniref:protoglobin domain-containing protein n=1 Tax=Geomonas sp. Red32 TaxID=2912856 RepID=UPI00202CF15C|nr:protoglobin domain-containing protein [Geomonas sp. Red32]MCM0084308.1 protoglobin domain-containing protein [Geomonas sp. Red32]